MKTKNIFKALAFAILIPAMLLTTACVNDEIPNEKGYELPVTINVTRQGDDASTKATYNGSTRKLEFSTGDKLYVSGYNATVGDYAGILDWQSGGTFSGTIITENEYTGTVDALLTAGSARAALLPAGYGTYGFISVVEKNGYDNMIMLNETKAFALTKATAIEQLSWETGNYDSSNGFVLAPLCAILNFTITGLTASTEYAVVVSDGSYGRDGSVTTNGSGTATFAVGVWDDTDSDNITLTLDGTPITLNLFGGTNTELVAGKIYNISRSGIALSAVTSAYIGSVVASDGNVYPAKTALPAGKTAVGILGKVTATSPSSHGLILALQDATDQTWNTIKGWTSVNTYADTELKVLPDDAARGSLTSYTTLGETTVSNWAVAQKSDYEAIFTNLGSKTGDWDGKTYDANVNAYITTGVGGTAISGTCWSATKGDGYNAWDFEGDCWGTYTWGSSLSVRPVLAF